MNERSAFPYKHDYEASRISVSYADALIAELEKK